jgi:hypothetical protein
MMESERDIFAPFGFLCFLEARGVHLVSGGQEYSAYWGFSKRGSDTPACRTIENNTSSHPSSIPTNSIQRRA